MAEGGRLGDALLMVCEIPSHTGHKQRIKSLKDRQHSQHCRKSSCMERSVTRSPVERYAIAGGIRQTNDYPSIKMHEFLKWADAYTRDLRERCNAAAVDNELAKSELW